MRQQVLLWGAGGGYVWSQRMQQQKIAMEQAAQGTPVQVSQTADNRLRINIPADASFAINSAVLNAHMYPLLDRLAQTLAQNPYATVSIVGHTGPAGLFVACTRGIWSAHTGIHI